MLLMFQDSNRKWLKFTHFGTEGETIATFRSASTMWVIRLTLRSMLVHPKDKTPKEKLCGTIYHIACDEETERNLSVRFKEHCKLDKPTGVGDHCNATGHSVSMDNLRVLAREQDWLKRKVKEAIHIKQRAPSMNRDQGYQLPPIYGQIIPRPPPPEPNHPP